MLPLRPGIVDAIRPTALCGKAARTELGSGRVMTRASLPLRRRELITLLGSAAASSVWWPLAARAQQPGKSPTIGFLGNELAMWSPWTAAFVQRLRELGWIEGRNVAIEY